jgi:hypothetical protein
MGTTSKNIIQKAVSKNGKKQIQKAKEFDEVILFPEQLAKVNALLEKAILLPHRGPGAGKGKALREKAAKKAKRRANSK